MRTAQGENVASDYDECVFRHNIDTALVNVRRILENTRNPQLPSEIPHRYDDKFLLAESICNVALAAQLNCLKRLGVDVVTLRKMKTWSGRRNVTLQFQQKEECSFNRTESREMERAPSHYVVETVSTKMSDFAPMPDALKQGAQTAFGKGENYNKFVKVAKVVKLIHCHFQCLLSP